MAFELNLNDSTDVKATPNVDAPTLFSFLGGTFFSTGKRFTDDHQVEWSMCICHRIKPLTGG
jgi:hypothetical protein